MNPTNLHCAATSETMTEIVADYFPGMVTLSIPDLKTLSDAEIDACVGVLGEVA